MAKEILIKTKLKSTAELKHMNIQHFHTNDINSAELVFVVEDMTAEELSQSKGVIYLRMKDGSFFKKEFKSGEVYRKDNQFRYALKDNELKHTGISETQLEVQISYKWYSSHLYQFKIVDGLNRKSQIEVEINDLDSETKKEIRDLKATWQALIDETTGKDIVSAPEIIAARNGEANLKARIDKDHQDLTAQLQQTETKIEAVENANSKQKLSFLNQYDNDQNIHPKVLDFGGLWNGYRYWMAYTPFPWRNDKQENPSVAAANEINKWQHKIMLADTPQPTNINHYNNDTHLVYRSNLNRLEVWWRYYNQPDNVVLIKRRTTTNGTTWSAEETMFSSTTANQILSPTIVFEDGKYKMWFCEPDGNVYYQENTDTEGKIWGERKLLNVPKPSDVRWWWHLDVIKTDLGYEFLVQGIPFGVPSAEYANLYYTKTTDNVNFDLPILILEPSKREGAFDNKGIYRSSFIKKEGTYYVFYSGFAQDGTTGLGLSTGADIQNLAGATSLNRYMSNVERIDLGYSYLKEGETKLSNGQFANVMRPSYADILRFYKANGTDSAEIGVAGVNVGNNYLKDNELKLTNGIYASIIKMLVSGYLEIKDNDGKPVALQVAGIKLNSTNALALGGEGVLKYDSITKKFQGSDGFGWQNLNREVTVPSSATANGTKGDYAVTSGYLYVCVATNTWQRVPLTTW